MPRGVLATTIAFALAGCGGDDDRANPEADARAAVADFVEALGDQDTER